MQLKRTVVTLLLILFGAANFVNFTAFRPLSPSMLAVQAQDGTNLAQQRRKETVRAVLEATYGRGDVAAMDSVYTPDFVRHPSQSDLFTVKAGILALRAAIPDLRVTVSLSIAEGRYVACRLKLQGTMINELVFPNSIPIPLTNQPITLLTNVIMRFNSEERIAEEWHGFDNLTFLVQIGAIPPPQTSGSVIPDFLNFNPSPREEQNKEAVQSYLAGLGQGNFGLLDSVLDPNLSAFSVFGLMNRDGQREDLILLRTAIPDLNYQLQQIVAEGDWVATAYLTQGHFTAPYAAPNANPIPPTNLPVSLLVITLYHFNDSGVIIESYELFDSFSFLSQLGLNVPRVPSG